MSYYSTSNNNASYGETPISNYGTITGRKNINNTNGSMMSGISSSVNNRKIKRSNIHGGRKTSIATTATTNHTLTTMSPQEKETLKI